MTSFHRHISSILALVMLFTSVINTVLVVCASGEDHNAIELIGHQTGFSDHSTEAFTVAIPRSPHEAHPETCTDTSLLSEAVFRPISNFSSLEDHVPQLFLVQSFHDLFASSIVFTSQASPIVPDGPRLQSTLDDLSSIRLLI